MRVGGDDDVHHVDAGEELVEGADDLTAVRGHEFLGTDLGEDDDVTDAEQVRQVGVGDHPRADEADPESLFGHGFLLVPWSGAGAGSAAAAGGEQGGPGQSRAGAGERLLDAGRRSPAEPGVDGRAQRGEQSLAGLAEPSADDDDRGVEHGREDRDTGGEGVDRVGPHRGGDGVGVHGGDDVLGAAVDGAAGLAVAPRDVPGGGVRLDAAALSAGALLAAGSDADVPDLAGTPGGADDEPAVDDQARGDAGADRDEDHLGDVAPGRGPCGDLGRRRGTGVVCDRDGDAVPVAEERDDRQVAPVEVHRDDDRARRGVHDARGAQADRGERVPGPGSGGSEAVDDRGDRGERRATGCQGVDDRRSAEGRDDDTVEHDVADPDHPLDRGAADVDGDDRAASLGRPHRGAHAVCSAAVRTRSSIRVGARTSSTASTVAPRMPASRGAALARTSSASATIGRHDR